MSHAGAQLIHAHIATIYNVHIALFLHSLCELLIIASNWCLWQIKSHWFFLKLSHAIEQITVSDIFWFFFWSFIMKLGICRKCFPFSRELQILKLTFRFLLIFLRLTYVLTYFQVIQIKVNQRNFLWTSIYAWSNMCKA